VRISEIRGQEKAIAALKRDLASARMAPSYLFIGPESVGKFTTAEAFASVLLCGDRQSTESGGLDACGHCASCRKVQAGVHPDLLVVRRDGQFIKVGDSEGERKPGEPPQIRQLIAAAQRRPYEGPVKAFLVDEAHRMNASAANALLKTLEEPPADTVIVLTATTLGALPQTIVSRCRVVRFRALERSWLAGEIARVRKLPDAEAGLLAIFCGGRMDRALEAEPQEVAERRRKALELLDAGVAGQAGAILASVGGVGSSREEAEALLDVFLVLVRDLSVAKRGVPPAFLINEDLAQEMGRRASQIPKRTLENLFERARKLRTDVRIRNANPQLGWEALLLSPQEAAVA